MKKDVIKISICILCIGTFYWVMTNTVKSVEREYWTQKKTRNCIFYYRGDITPELEMLVLMTQKNIDSLVIENEKIKIFVNPVKNTEKQSVSISKGTIFCFKNSTISKKILLKVLKYNKKSMKKYKRYKPAAR